jgi:prolyl 4-hydroxylase
MADSALYRVSIRSHVIDRLRVNPAAFQVPASNLDMFTVRDFLTPEECEGLIRLIDEDRQPSTVLGTSSDPEYRTSESCNLDPQDPLVRQVEAKITDLLGIAPEHGETIQGQRYAVGQQFKAHHDFFYASEEYWEVEEKQGGQRTWTAMMFLNKPEAGGQTYFERAGVRITPRIGNLLCWNNLDLGGEPNMASLHQGLPVEAGVKYVITKWYRERRWGRPPEEAEAAAQA